MARRSRKRAIVPQASPAVSSHAKKPITNPMMHSGVDFVMKLQRTIGNRAVGSLLHSGMLQAKLKIGTPGDRYEQQADTIANQVVSMPESSVQRSVDEEKKIQTSPIAAAITPLVQTAAEEKKEQPVMRKSVGEDEELPVQGKANSDGGAVKSGSITSQVEAGLSAAGEGRPLSDSDRAYFEPRFGASFEEVRLHTDSNSAQLSSNLNAQAFTIGKEIYFGTGKYDSGSSTGKKLLAHELTHVVQQNGAGKLLQRYTVYDASDQAANKSLGWKHPASDDLNVADDGKLAVGERGGDAWAFESNINSSEATLKSINSDIKLEKGSGSISGKAPSAGKKGATRTLKEVKVVNRVGGGRADLTADCGTTARQVMGIHDPDKFSAVNKRNGTGVESYTPSEEYYGGAHTTTEEWFEQICKKEFGAALSGADARARYDALTPKKKDSFDKKYGINRYAKPRIGQAITIDRPSGWNFHFAGVILKSGPDYVTTENFPGSGRDSQSWYFEIYGPESKNQSFFDDWKDVSGSSVMVVESDKARTGKAIGSPNLVRDPKKYKTTKIATLSSDTLVLVTARNESWRKVIVQSGPHTGKEGWISNAFFTLR